jgi:hypothetical protein
MPDSTPSIASLQLIVLNDNRRVTFELEVENLPATVSNVFFSMPDMEADSAVPPRPDPDAPSPYPDLELSILNRQRQQVASLLIVEHKEPSLALTLHLRAPDPQEPYIARAQMVYQNEPIDVMEVPFTLNPEARNG